MDRDEELEDKVTEVNTRLAEAAEPDAREQAPAAVKRQAKQREEGQADKRETDPEYLAKLEDFKRAQEALRLKQENFQRRQREYEARKAAKLAEKEARVRALSQQQADFLKKRAERGKADHLARCSEYPTAHQTACQMAASWEQQWVLQTDDHWAHPRAESWEVSSALHSVSLWGLLKAKTWGGWWGSTTAAQ